MCYRHPLSVGVYTPGPQHNGQFKWPLVLVIGACWQKDISGHVTKVGTCKQWAVTLSTWSVPGGGMVRGHIATHPCGEMLTQLSVCQYTHVCTLSVYTTV